MDVDEVQPEDPAAVADRLVDRFVRLHGREPAGCFAAPGRVNLIGEHVDYNGGRVLPLALPHATYAAVGPRPDRRLTVSSRQEQEPWSGSVDEVGPGRVRGWAAYVAGVVWALQDAGTPLPGLDVVVDGHVPVGAGLSSSAALECSVALGLCAVAGVADTDEVRRALVDVCVRAEQEVAGAPTGGMDQTVSLLAHRGHALLIDFRDRSTRHVPWDPAADDTALLVVDTRSRHALVDGGYAARRADCEEAARLLGVRALADVTDSGSALASLPEGRLRRRARHVLGELGRVDEAVGQVTARDHAALGRTLDASHSSLRDDFEVSTVELDVTVETAREHGAFGARMTGGGFGGSAIALLPVDRVRPVAEAVAGEFARRGWGTPRLLRAVPGPGGRRIR